MPGEGWGVAFLLPKTGQEIPNLTNRPLLPDRLQLSILHGTGSSP